MNIIRIKGEIIPFKILDWMTEYEDYCNEEEILNQLEGKTGDITVEIDSKGGDVDEGFKIYSTLRRYAKDNNAKVTTKAVGRCDSIAISIFLAGDKRIANKFLEPFVHNPYVYMDDAVDKNILKRAYEDLNSYTDRIAKHYSNHTKLSIDDAKQLMDNNTSVSPEEMVELGFAHEVEDVLRPVALNKILNRKPKNKHKSNTNEMKAETKLNQLLKAMEGVLNKKEAPKNAIELATSTGEMLVFNELEEDDVPEVGDKATLNGKNASGDILLQDGRTFNFNKGVLNEIKDAEEDEEIKNLKSQIAEQGKKIDALTKNLEAFNKVNKENDAVIKQLGSLMSGYSDDTEEPDNNPKNLHEPKGKTGGLSGALKNAKKTK